MSQNASAQQQVQPGAGTVQAQDPQANTSRGRGRGRGPRRGGRQRSEARRIFSPQAAKQGMERYFTEWQSEQRSNCEVHLTTDLPIRLVQSYCNHARDYIFHRGSDEEQAYDAVHSTSALSFYLAAKKLLMTQPQSQSDQVRDLWHLKQMEMFGPAALISIYDHLGKFDNANDHVRVAYSAMHIKRWFLGGLQQLALHSHAFPEWQPVDGGQRQEPAESLVGYNLDNAVFPDQDSAQWIRDSARNFLIEELRRTFQVQIIVAGQPQNITVSPPYVHLTGDFVADRRRIVAWLATIDINLPRSLQLLIAGLLCIVQVEWLRRPHEFVRVLDPDLPANIGDQTRVSTLLGQFNLYVPFYAGGDYAQPSQLNQFADLVSRGYGWLMDNSMPLFRPLFNMTRQPDNPYGDEAQLVPVPLGQRVERTRVDKDGIYQELPNDPAARVSRKIDNRAHTALGLVFGFSHKVVFKDVLVGRLNTGSTAVSKQYLSEDKNNFF
jgi:hypothetical protein